jgi:hypothetical protein
MVWHYSLSDDGEGGGMFEVVGTPPKEINSISSKSEESVAVLAQKSADPTSSVAVVDCESSGFPGSTAT